MKLTPFRTIAFALKNEEIDKLNEEIHKLIVEKDDMFDEAVRIREERDRLRNIMQQSFSFIEGAIATMSMILADAEMSKAVGEYRELPKDMLEAFVADGKRILHEASIAIKFPTRNIDNFATHNEAKAAFLKTYFGPTEPEFVEEAFSRWLFNPVKKETEK